jgi:hypothetical protein
MIEFEAGGKLYKIHKPTLGTQMMVLSRHKDEPEQFRLMKTLEASIKTETAPGSGVFRSLKNEEFAALDDDTFKPFKRAFMELRGRSNARLAILEDFLEYFPDAPLEIHAWAQSVRAEVEAEDPFA